MMPVAHVVFSADLDQVEGHLLVGSVLADAARALRRQSDPVWGGFGSAPKFPPASVLEFLLRRGELEPEDVDQSLVASYLGTAGIPDPDLLIRTSGEMRISNFLLWQIAYAEIWVTDTLWPDFRKRHLLEAILAYQKRDRRYGGINQPAVAGRCSFARSARACRSLSPAPPSNWWRRPGAFVQT